jgi:hypothetical protein
MKTIQTKPDCTLGFIPAPKLEAGGWITSHDAMLDEKITLIGKLSEITEEQARELLDSFLHGGFVVYKDYIDPTNSYFNASVLSSLKSAALSVGIEEKDFDKYLVIKL